MVPSRPKYIRRLYEPILLLRALGIVRSKPFKIDPVPPDEYGFIIKHQRKFADNLAYIASHEKTPSGITAAALERREKFIRVWLAGNCDIENKVKEFIQKILDTLSRVAQRKSYTEEECASVTEEVVVFCRHRIQKYYEKARTLCLELSSESCLVPVFGSANQRNSQQSQIIKLLRSLRDTIFIDETPSDELLRILPMKCHSQRDKRTFEPLSSDPTDNEKYDHALKRLFKLLNKLGKHVTVTRRLFEATVALSSDFQRGFIVDDVPSSKEKHLPLVSKEGTINTIIGRMFSSKTEQDNYRQRLSSLNESEEIEEILSNTRKNKKTKVHAELLLIDHFHRHKLEFINNEDKYIGCSKPACYLCHIYVSNHPGGYKVSGSHQKLYIGWRMPEINPDSDQESSNIQARRDMEEQIARGMIEKVRSDLVAETNSLAKMPPPHEDSTAGVTSEPFQDVYQWLEEDFEKLSTGHTETKSIAYVQEYEDTEDEDGGVTLH